MLFGTKPLVGIDIGTSSIKMVELEPKRKSYTLKNFGFIATPKGAINGGEIIDIDSLANAIRMLVQEANIKAKRACTAIWGTAVITKKISIPQIEERLLPEQLRWEAEQYIPFDINEINLEYHVLKNAPASPGQMNVLLVAAKRDFVLRYAEVVELAGLNCSVVDVAGFALANSFEANYGVSKNETIALLNIGCGVTNFVIIENGEVTFSRDIPVGGLTYSMEIQKSLAISFEEADTMKISASTGQAVPQEVKEVLTQTNEVVVEEIRRSFDFFLATSQDVVIHRIYVTGGSVAIAGFVEHLHAGLKIPIEMLNGFQKVGFNRRSFDADYIDRINRFVPVSIGLGMRQDK